MAAKVRLSLPALQPFPPQEALLIPQRAQWTQQDFPLHRGQSTPRIPNMVQRLGQPLPPVLHLTLQHHFQQVPAFRPVRLVESLQVSLWPLSFLQLWLGWFTIVLRRTVDKAKLKHIQRIRAHLSIIDLSCNILCPQEEGHTMCMAMKGANFEKSTVLYRGNNDRESEYMPSVLAKGTPQPIANARGTRPGGKPAVLSPAVVRDPPHS